MLQSTNVDIHTHMSTHFYTYIYTHSNFMSTSERLDRFDLEIHKVGQIASHY
jgi:hypothetical protein